MVTRQQVERLEQRIEGLIEQRARQHRFQILSELPISGGSLLPSLPTK